MKKKASHGKKNAASKDDNSMVFGIVVFVALVVVVAGVIWLVSMSGESRMKRDAAAVVNGEVISMDYIDDQYDRIPELYRGFITKQQLVNQSIDEVLLLQAAKKAGIEVSSEDISAEIDSAMERAGVSDEELESRLAQQNITRDFLEELYEKQLRINELLEKEVFKDISVDYAEVSDEYDSKIRAMHILVDSESEAKDIIEDLKKVSLNDIESEFSKVAVERSTDPSASVNGGDLGEFGKGAMVAPFEKAAFALEEYTFTAKPVQTQFGYHIVLRLPKDSTLEEEYDELEQSLLTQKKADAVPAYLQGLRDAADIQVYYSPEEEAS